MKRWKREENQITPTDVAQLVSKGFVVLQEEIEENKVRGTLVRITHETHAQLDALAKQIPGATKERLLIYFIEAGLYEFCKALVNNADEHEQDKLFDQDAQDDTKEVFEKSLSLLGKVRR